MDTENYKDGGNLYNKVLRDLDEMNLEWNGSLGYVVSILDLFVDFDLEMIKIT